MSTPRWLTQVTVPASGTSGAGVTLSVADPSWIIVGQLLELFPSQFRDGSPLSRAGQTVRFLVSANPNTGQLTGTMNWDGFANPPQVAKGWLVDGHNPANVQGYVLEAPTFAGIRAASAAAYASGGGKVVCAGGKGAVVYDGTSIPPYSDVTVECLDGTWLQTTSSGTQYLIAGGVGPTSSVVTFTGTVTIGASAATLSAPITGLAKGDLVAIMRIGIAFQMLTVRSVSGTAVTFYQPFAWAFTTAFTVQKFASEIRNYTFIGEMRNPVNPDTEVRGLNISGAQNLAIKDATFSGFGKAQEIVQLAIAVPYVVNMSILNTTFVDCGTHGSGGITIACFHHLVLENVSCVVAATGAALYCQPTQFSYGTDLVIDNSNLSGFGRVVELSHVAKVRLMNSEISAFDIPNGDNPIALESLLTGTVGAQFLSKDIRVVNCTVQGGVVGFNAGGAFLESTDITFENTRFVNNTTDISLGTGVSNVFIDDATTYTTISSVSTTLYGRWDAGAAAGITQGGALNSVTQTINRVLRHRNYCEFSMVLTVANAAGAVAGNNIAVGLPGANAAAGPAANFGVVGYGEIVDASTGLHYVVVATLANATLMVLQQAEVPLVGYQGGAGSSLAAVALAAGDIIRLAGSYETV